MRYLLIIIFSLFLSGCALEKVRHHSQFEHYVQDFELNCKKEVLIPIAFAEMPSNVYGRCIGFQMPMLFRRIEINPTYWRRADYFGRESTMLHELGHCILDLDHDESFTNDYYIFKRPRSLMYPHDFYQYRWNRDEYREKLFKECK